MIACGYPQTVTLRRDGIVTLDEVLTPKQANDAKWMLAVCPRFHGHVYEASSPLMKPNSHAVCWHPSDVLSQPYLFESILAWTPVAAEYLGTLPRLYSVNVFTSFGVEERPNIQQFHRDHDDTRFVGLFVYLSDVLEREDGAHEYVPGSHVEDTGRGGERSILGPAGTAFMADTSGLHRGMPPCKPRTMFWARWGVSEVPASYAGSGTQPVPRSVLGDRYPSDPELQRSIELVVK